MARLVWILLLALAVVALWRGARRRDAARPDAATPPPRRGAAPEAMVRCAHCGLYLAAADALQDGERSYCSEAHRLAGPARPR
ncbi:MAG TPA: PP0621 family protein [Burkholderiaceae bacterium]|nr:PP0621 family protein [Burkholderiaceae bacterium]HNB47663.1 PP0621 family protein [Burkholderiaceae bacterium]